MMIVCFSRLLYEIVFNIFHILIITVMLMYQVFVKDGIEYIIMITYR